MTPLVARLLPPLVPAVVAVAGLELLVRYGFVRAFLVPAPSTVARTLWADARPLLDATVETAAGALGGFGLAVGVGVTLAVLLASSRWAERAFYLYAVFFQTVPIIAVAPLLVIWLGNDLDAVIASAAIVSLFPVIANTLAGLRSTDPNLHDLFTLCRASAWHRLVKLRLPSALPSVLTGLRVGAGLSVIGAIVGEFITTGSGLGGLMTVARQRQRVDLVFAALLLSAMLGLGLFAAINLAGRLTLGLWHVSEKPT